MGKKQMLEANGLWFKKQYGKHTYWHMEKPSDSVLEIIPNTRLDHLPTIIDYLNKEDAEYPGIGRVSEDHFYFRKKKPKEGNELPFGFYKHKEGQFPFPERLEEVTVREEAYFDRSDVAKFVKKDIDLFLKSKNVYAKIKAFYKRGYLLYGPPGNGKTGFIRNLISKGIPKESHVIWLSRLPSVAMTKTLKEMDSLKVFIIEEISAVSGDNYYTKQLLEWLDGEESPDNCILIATTNYPASLEQNMADRPSRFDVNLEIKDPNAEEAKYFFEKFLSREIEENEVPLKDLSVAYIKEICLRHLMYEVPLKEAYDQVIISRKKFKNNFVEKNQLGLGLATEKK